MKIGIAVFDMRTRCCPSVLMVIIRHRDPSHLNIDERKASEHQHQIKAFGMAKAKKTLWLERPWPFRKIRGQVSISRAETEKPPPLFHLQQILFSISPLSLTPSSQPVVSAAPCHAQRRHLFLGFLLSRIGANSQLARKQAPPLLVYSYSLCRSDMLLLSSEEYCSPTNMCQHHTGAKCHHFVPLCLVSLELSPSGEIGMSL